MKNKFLMAFIMLFLVGICCIPTDSYAACPAIYGGCNYSSATCTKLATCSRCGATKGGYASHSYGSYRVSTDATCTNEGSKVRYCGNCGKADWGTIAAKGHTGGSLSDNKNASQHWRTCTRCWGGYDHQSHGGGTWYPDGASHYKDCSTCGYKKYTSGAHDSDKKVDYDNSDDYHDTYCNTCWQAGYININKGTEGHTWDGGEDVIHYCTKCDHKMVDTAKDYHYYPGLTSGYISAPTYSCGTCGETLTILNGTYPTLHLDGLPESKYVASDASIAMETVPTLPHGTYTLFWTNGDSSSPKLRDGGGNIVTPQVNPADVALDSWGRKNLKTHATKTADYAKASYEKQMELNGYAIIDENHVATSEDELYAITDMIDSDINRASSHEKEDWNGVLYSMCKNVYRNGSSYEPTITQPSPTSYNLTYNHPAGGWVIKPNKFNSSPTLLDSLFQYGGYESEPAVPWVANIYYCYRVYGTGGVPKNGYKSLYTYKTVTVYNSGPIDVTVSIPADMNLIDKTGYRYVGVATQVSSVGNIRPASAPTSSASTGTVTVGWDYNRAAAIITFFVEPVKLSYGNKAVNYNGNIINIVAASHEGRGLEFPDYYDKSAGRCYIPVSASYSSSVIEPLESLNKFWWPGYILESSKVWKEGTTTVIRRK